MEYKSLNSIIQLAEKKKNILSKRPFEYFTRAALAGFYATAVVVVSFKVGNALYEQNSPFAYLIAGLIFCIALVMIVFGSAELFTGNTMYFTVGMLRGAVTWKDTMKNWLSCYVGNFIGVLIFTVIFYYSGIFSTITEHHFLFHVVQGKTSASGLELFLRSILCNWLVCLACFMPYRFENEVAKLIVIIMLVTCFFVSGYEHSIANMCLFSLTYALQHAHQITLASMIHNVVIVTFGNIIGGAVLVGFVFHFITPMKESR